MYGLARGETLTNKTPTRRTSVPPPANDPPVTVSPIKVVTDLPPPAETFDPEPDSGRYSIIHKRRSPRKARP